MCLYKHLYEDGDNSGMPQKRDKVFSYLYRNIFCEILLQILNLRGPSKEWSAVLVLRNEIELKYPSLLRLQEWIQLA